MAEHAAQRSASEVVARPRASSARATRAPRRAAASCAERGAQRGEVAGRVDVELERRQAADAHGRAGGVRERRVAGEGAGAEGRRDDGWRVEQQRVRPRAVAVGDDHDARPGRVEELVDLGGRRAPGSRPARAAPAARRARPRSGPRGRRRRTDPPRPGRSRPPARRAFPRCPPFPPPRPRSRHRGPASSPARRARRAPSPRRARADRLLPRRRPAAASPDRTT